MKRIIVEISKFSKEIDKLIEQNRILIKDFEDFKNYIAFYPEDGDIVSGTGGVRKIRLKSAYGGKSGGFRIYYYDHQIKYKLVLLLICAKNKIENITDEEKKILKGIVDKIKEIKYE